MTYSVNDPSFETGKNHRSASYTQKNIYCLN